MISWMQKHKKWLVITIWISTIAFVGAGFVGWGSYDYGKQGGVVAVVGDREVSVEEYQQEYSTIYEQYASTFGSMFNQEMADKLNLKDVAFKQVVQKNLILSYADSLGLDVTDEDIAKQLVTYKAFVKNGKFDKATYVKVLSQNRMTPLQFEDSLKRNLLLQKVQKLFKVSPSQNEIENLSKLLNTKDDIIIKILSSNEIKVDFTQDDLKEYWEKNKDKYLSKVLYEIQTSEIEVTSSNPSDADIDNHYTKFKLDFKKEDGKLKTKQEAKEEIIKALDKKASKTKALKKYLKIKKNQEKLTNNKTYQIDKLPFSSKDNEKIKASKNGDTIKPFIHEDKYIVVKLVKKIDAKPLSFDLAKPSVQKNYLAVKKNEKLEQLANKELKNFDGTKIFNVSRDSKNKIVGLSKQEEAQFLNQLFSTTKKESMVKLNNKIVLFKIVSSKLGSTDNKEDKAIKNILENIQDQELMVNLVEKLKNTYEIQSSIDIKE